MAQSIKASVAALYAACQTLYAAQTGPDGSPVLVTYGPPGSYQPEAIVAVAMAVREPITQPTASTNRSREKAAEIDVIISVEVHGGDAVAQIAAEKAYDLSELLESYFRTGPNETLGGACRNSFVSRIDFPNLSVTYDPDSGNAVGRNADLTVTVVAQIRQ